MRPLAVLVLAITLHALPASAQPQETATTNTALDVTNPVSLLQNASTLLASEQERQAQPRTGLSATLSILMLLTVLTVAPALLMLCTSFTRIVVVLALLRQAMGTQSLPPSQVIVGLAMFLTFLIMAPTFERVHKESFVPLQANQIDAMEAWSRAKQPIRDFMFAQIEHTGNWADLYMILNYRGVDTSDPGKLQRADVDLVSLIPAFILSELKTAFLMGFKLYLPFLVIDMVISSVLISMGMLMLPPVLISLPFKLLLFVLVDGWMLVTGNLLNSFSVPGVTS